MDATGHRVPLPAVGGAEGRAPDVPFPGVTRRSHETPMATVAAYAFEPGAEFPLHSHPQEQITVVLEGEVECEVAGETHDLGAGETIVIASGVEHGIRAGEHGARFLAVVVPPRAGRDDYTIEA